MRRRTVRSMEKTTAQTAYDALWIALGEEHLASFAGAASRSAEGSTGPLAGETVGFWAGLSRTRAMSLYDAFERLAPGADSHDSDTVERLSRALVGIEADPEWMRLVEQGGEFKGSRVFGSQFPSTEHVLLDSETPEDPQPAGPLPVAHGRLRGGGAAVARRPRRGLHRRRRGAALGEGDRQAHRPAAEDRAPEQHASNATRGCWPRSCS